MWRSPWILVALCWAAVGGVACAPPSPPASPVAEPSSPSPAPATAPTERSANDELDAANPPLLVSLAVLESGDPGGGGIVDTIVVTQTGEVTLESRRWGADGAVQEPAVSPCRPMSDAELDDLGRRVHEAQAALRAASYSTSSRPPPAANYSRSQTYRFAPTARFPEVSVAGWADVPIELSRLGDELTRRRASCGG